MNYPEWVAEWPLYFPITFSVAATVAAYQLAGVARATVLQLALAAVPPILAGVLCDRTGRGRASAAVRRS